MKRTISLSKHLGTTRIVLEKAGVFDSTLGIDTKLFIDPKLLTETSIPEFSNSRLRILEYFEELLRIHRQSNVSPRLREEVISRLATPEPPGLSIGYGNKTDNGTSIPRNIAISILRSASEILAVGINDPEIMELLCLFVKGFGPDSISDLTVHIIYEELCNYTQRIAKEINCKVKKFNIGNNYYTLPSHPFKKLPVIFIPIEVLCPLPIVNSWDDISSAAQQNMKLREEMSKIVFPVLRDEITKFERKSDDEKRVVKEGIISLLKVYREIEIAPYDLAEDKCGYYGINPFVESNDHDISPSSKPKDAGQLIVSVRELIQQYRRAIEDNGGNRLLYRKDSSHKLLADQPHREDVAQIIFYLISDIYCEKANILLSREPNAGRGPVDFSLGTGYDAKAIVEVKKSTNNDLLGGYSKQVTTYQKSERAAHSFYVVLKVREAQQKKKGKKTVSQLEKLEEIYQDYIRKKIPCPELVVIDAIVHPSASKL